MKFTFKTEKSKGRYRSFYNDHHYVKLKKEKVGSISDDLGAHKIRLRVVKDDINEDGNPNSKFKWITLKGTHKTLQDAKDFLNTNIIAITTKWKLLDDED